MRIIYRKNALSIICISYTLVSLFIIISEMVLQGGSSPTHLNLLMGLVFTLVSIGILSLHHLLDRFSPPLMMIIIQYSFGIIAVVLLTFLLGFLEPLHPDAYKDMIRSFSSLYSIGAIIYYFNLRLEIKRQNAALDDIERYKADQ